MVVKPPESAFSANIASIKRDDSQQPIDAVRTAAPSSAVSASQVPAGT